MAWSCTMILCIDLHHACCLNVWEGRSENRKWTSVNQKKRGQGKSRISSVAIRRLLASPWVTASRWSLASRRAKQQWDNTVYLFKETCSPECVCCILSPLIALTGFQMCGYFYCPSLQTCASLQSTTWEVKWHFPFSTQVAFAWVQFVWVWAAAYQSQSNKSISIPLVEWCTGKKC